MKYIRENVARAPQYVARPVVKNQGIKRICLVEGCDVEFTAQNRFLRLCPGHRREA